jgi:hypothetical protein
MWWTAVILGVVEGLTEFLPISSTGHLIVAGHLLGYTGAVANTFEIAIQLGAILSVVFYYRRKLTTLITHSATNADARRLLVGLGLAFLPAAGLGSCSSNGFTHYPARARWRQLPGGRRWASAWPNARRSSPASPVPAQRSWAGCWRAWIERPRRNIHFSWRFRPWAPPRCMI